MNNEFNVNEIVKVETMAVIKQQLDKVELFVDEKVKDIPKVLKELEKMSDKEKEEKKQEIKQYRTYLKKINEELENKRKEIKDEINKPYDEFNKYYSEGVKIKLKNGVEQLSNVIDDIEDKQKQEKEKTLREFFQEYQTSNHLEGIVEFENVGLNITISASEKSLKEQIKAFCEKVANDIKAIQTDENSEEVLLEYKNNGFDYAKAKTTLAERKKQLEEFKQHIAKNGEEIKQEEITIHNIETMVSAPKEVVEEEKNWYEFSALMTNTQAKELKEWFRDRNIEMR